MSVVALRADPDQKAQRGGRAKVDAAVVH